MKANELMIGDWVIFHDSGYASDGTTWEENRVCQIDSIDEVVRVKWYDESGYEEDWPHVSTGLLSPIPLTPEILEKNGFIVESRENHGHNLQYCILTDGLWIDISGENFFEGKLEYVHQLQHALRLCGIDKTIEL